MEKTWLRHYPAGVPAEIDVAQYRTLVELLEESFAKYRDATAYIPPQKRLIFYVIKLNK